MWRFPKGKPLGVLVYILVEDIDKTIANVVKQGGKVVVPKSREGQNAMATIADPDGNLFGLYEYAKNE
jgi:predicted enzyme related to lactoylglutathione lyase